MLEIIRESKTGLIIPPDTSLQQWCAIGEAFNRADDLLCWCIGDWIAFGADKEWGAKYVDAINATGIEYSSLRMYASVSQRIPIAMRMANLSWTHHSIVASLDADARDMWLRVAQDTKLSTRELSASIKAGKIVRISDIEAERLGRKGLSGPHAILSVFNRAIRDVSSRVPLDKWSSATRLEWKNQLKPIVELYNKL